MFFRAAAFRADAFAARFLGSEVGGAPEPAPEQQPTGGWHTLPRDFGRSQHAEARRRERERLGIEPAQQRAIDRAAVKIAPTVTQGGLVSPQAVIAAPAFDRLLMIVRPSEGDVAALVQAILDRLAWMAEQDEEDEAIPRLMMEMD